MKIRGSKSQILYGIQMVQNTVSTRASLPILLNILLETNKKDIGDNKLRLTTTDLEMTSKCIISVEVEEEGGITVPARLFFEIIKELPEKEVFIQTKENNVQIKCEKSKFTVFGLPQNEFPTPPEINEGVVINLNDNILKQMIHKTKFAVSSDETRHPLTGVCFILKDKDVRMVATNGHRIAYIKEDNPQQVKDEISAIIPVKALNEIVRTFPEEGEKVKIVISKNYTSFHLNETSLTTRLIEGTFPNYERVIPKDFDKNIQVDTQGFLAAIRRVSLLSDERSSLVKINIKGDSFIISGSAASSGEGAEEISVKNQGSDIEIGFNARYLVDILRVIDSEETVIKLSTPSSPVLIHPYNKDPKEENCLYVVMPLRL